MKKEKYTRKKKLIDERNPRMGRKLKKFGILVRWLLRLTMDKNTVSFIKQTFDPDFIHLMF